MAAEIVGGRSSLVPSRYDRGAIKDTHAAQLPHFRFLTSNPAMRIALDVLFLRHGEFSGHLAVMT